MRDRDVAALRQLQDRLYASVSYLIGGGRTGHAAGGEAVNHLVAEATVRAQDNVLDAVDAGRGPTENFAAWLFVVARNATRDVLRSERRRILRERAFAEGGGRPPQAKLDPLAASGIRDSIAIATHLNARELEVLKLRFTHGLALVEIGARLGIPLNTVKSRLNRAQKRLTIRSNAAARQVNDGAER